MPVCDVQCVVASSVLSWLYTLITLLLLRVATWYVDRKAATAPSAVQSEGVVPLHASATPTPRADAYAAASSTASTLASTLLPGGVNMEQLQQFAQTISQGLARPQPATTAASAPPPAGGRRSEDRTLTEAERRRRARIESRRVQKPDVRVVERFSAEEEEEVAPVAVAEEDEVAEGEELED
jgi:hypothetical protein